MKDTYYMKHDINTSQDNAIVSMRVDYGTYGYGLFWLVNEYLRSQTRCKVKISEVKNIAFSFNEDFEKVHKFIDDCINIYSLYHSDGDYFWSDRMIVDKDHLDSVRQTYRDNGKKGGRPKAKGNQGVNQAVNLNETNGKAKPNQTESNKGKVSKGNKINKDNYGEFKNVHLSKDEYKKCIDKHTLVTTNKAIEKLSSFKASKGKIYKSDYAALNNWVWDSLEERKKPDSTEKPMEIWK